MKKQLKILHISQRNDAGVPLEYVKCHIDRGHISKLISFHKNPYLKEDKDEIILNYPSDNIPFYSLYHKLKESRKVKEHFSRNTEAPNIIPIVHNRTSFFAKVFLKIKDLVINARVKKVIKELDLENWDIIHLDNGLGFYSDSRFIKKMKSKGKKIICCYHGSDLRLRGVVPVIDKLNDLNITSEYDLLDFHPNIKHLFYPWGFPKTNKLSAPFLQDDSPIIIGHSPTNRLLKGSDLIEKVINELKEKFNIEYKSIEGLKRADALKLKAECHILIDQIGGKGGTGYGVSALESFAFKQMVVSDFTAKYNDFMKPHPFILAKPQTLKMVLEIMLSDRASIRNVAKLGNDWLNKNHGYKSVGDKLSLFYSKLGITY